MPAVAKLFAVHLRRVFAMGIVGLLWSQPVLGYPLWCTGDSNRAAIAAAIDRIRTSVDPCGESPRVFAVLDTLDRCAATNYQICTNLQSDLNSFDRPLGNSTGVRTITWNPALQTVVERGCDGDPAKPVLRDATASLLHELAHAAQDCDGLDPNAHEFDAVRIENIYRRAAGLCQRSKYGEDSLPSELLTVCEPGHCLCASRVGPGNQRMVTTSAGAQRARTDGAASADAQPSGVAR